MKRRYEWVWWDVFTSRPLTGNQLLIFPDARGLSTQKMQALAREAALSETAFIVPKPAAVERKCGVRVRIFTPREELRFAGHPALGAAMFLRSRTARPQTEVVLDLGVGRIPVRFTVGSRGMVFGEMRQIDPKFGATHDPVKIAPLLGLSPEDIVSDPPIQSVSTGLPYVIVGLRSLGALGSLRIDWRAALQYLGRKQPVQIFYCVTTASGNRKARLRARCIDVANEDPATGSAAGCAAAWMVRHGLADPDEQVLIEQGHEIARPSQIFVRAGMRTGRVIDVRVGGHAVEVMRGEYRFRQPI